MRKLIGSLSLVVVGVACVPPAHFADISDTLARRDLRCSSVMVAEFEIEGQKFVALNGGPQFKFSEAISFQISCETQEDVDYFWSKLSAGGQEGPCGWLKDKFGLSWQVVPTVLPQMLSDADSAKTERVTNAFLRMKKFDIAALRRAYEGQAAA